jgi:hypothetical protein
MIFFLPCIYLSHFTPFEQPHYLLNLFKVAELCTRQRSVPLIFTFWQVALNEKNNMTSQIHPLWLFSSGKQRHYCEIYSEFLELVSCHAI